jgi:hypothetical protein
MARCKITTTLSREDAEPRLRSELVWITALHGYQCIEFLDENMAVAGYHARDGLHVAQIGIEWFCGQ